MIDTDDSAYIRKLRERLSQKPDSRLFLSLAEEMRKRNKGDEAVELLSDGIRKNPDFVAAQLTLGRWYLQSTRFAEAQAQFTGVLKKEPANSFALKGLAEVNRVLGNAPVLQPAPAPPAVHKPVPSGTALAEFVQADQLIALGHYTPVMELYKEMLMDNPGDKRILQRKEELAALIKFLGKNKESTVKRLNRFLEAIRIQFAQKA